jgi:hypothetical protein
LVYLLFVTPILAIVSYPFIERYFARSWDSVAWTQNTAYRSGEPAVVHRRAPGVVRFAAGCCFVFGSLVPHWLYLGAAGLALLQALVRTGEWAGDALMIGGVVLLPSIVCTALAVLHARAGVLLLRRAVDRASFVRKLARFTLAFALLQIAFIGLVAIWMTTQSSRPRIDESVYMAAFAITPWVLTIIHARLLHRACAALSPATPATP